ncbi:hypothetical protein SOVF_081090, partial [Spinacia oleracea]
FISLNPLLSNSIQPPLHISSLLLNGVGHQLSSQTAALVFFSLPPTTSFKV